MDVTEPPYTQDVDDQRIVGPSPPAVATSPSKKKQKKVKKSQKKKAEAAAAPPPPDESVSTSGESEDIIPMVPSEEPAKENPPPKKTVSTRVMITPPKRKIMATSMKRHQNKGTPGRLTKGTLRRLCRRGGIRTVTQTTYPLLEVAARDFLINLLRRAMLVCRHGNRSVIRTSDVAYAAENIGRPLLGISE